MTRQQAEFKLGSHFTIAAYLKTNNDAYLAALNEPPKQVDITEQQLQDIEAMAQGFHKWKNLEQFHARLTSLQEVELTGKRSRSTADTGVMTIKGVSPQHVYAFLDVSAKLGMLQDAAKENGWRLIELRLTPIIRNRRDDLGRWYQVAESPTLGRVAQWQHYANKHSLWLAYRNAMNRVVSAYNKHDLESLKNQKKRI